MKVLLSTSKAVVAARFSDCISKIPAPNPPHEAVNSLPHEGLVAAVLSGHSDGSRYDMVIAEDVIHAEKDIRWSRILLERGLSREIPFVLLAEKFDDKLKIEGVFPETVLLLEPPHICEHLTELMELRLHGLIAREEARRAAAIELLMRFKKIAGDLSTSVDDIYMSSARQLDKYIWYLPWSALPYVAMGKIFTGCNRHQNAIPYLKTAIAIDFHRQEAHRLLALCYRRTGQSLDEVKELEEMLADEPLNSELLLRMGEFLLRDGDYEAAGSHFKKAIENFKPSEGPRRHAKMHVGLGKTLVMEGDKTNTPTKYVFAKIEFDFAVKTDPTLIAAYNNLVIVYRKLGMFGEAKKLIDTVLAISPTEAEDWMELFEMYLANGDNGKARFALHKAESCDPDNQRILCIAGETYIRQGMFREAITQFEKALKVNPSDVRLYNYLGICHRRLAELDVAVKYYLTALKIEPEDQNIHFNLGKAYQQNNEGEKAADCFKRALAIDPSFLEAKRAAETAEKHAGPDDQRNVVR